MKTSRPIEIRNERLEEQSNILMQMIVNHKLNTYDKDKTWTTNDTYHSMLDYDRE
jgi:hypothetical protein